jgi:hypothetical protein
MPESKNLPLSACSLLKLNLQNLVPRHPCGNLTEPELNLHSCYFGLPDRDRRKKISLVRRAVSGDTMPAASNNNSLAALFRRPHS